MKISACLVLIVLFSSYCVPSSALPQAVDSGQVLRVRVELVQLDVRVLSKKAKHSIGSLTPKDFQLYEDGARQEIAYVSQDKLPLSIVFLFDLTESVRPVLKPLAQGALKALEHLKPEDEVAVMAYAASAELLQDFTTDRNQIVAAIEKASEMRSREAAFFNEAIFQAASQLGKATNPNDRKVIIWLTDNVPNIPNETTRRQLGKSVPKGALHTEKDAFHELLATGASVNALLECSALSDFMIVSFSKNPLFAPFRSHNPPGDAHKYAEQTGGETMSSSKEDVSSKLAELIDDIRSRYTIGYYPSTRKSPGTFCKIKLQVMSEDTKNRDELSVHTKTGYYRR